MKRPLALLVALPVLLSGLALPLLVAPGVDAQDGLPEGAIPCRISVSVDTFDTGPSPILGSTGTLTEHASLSGTFDGYLDAREKKTGNFYDLSDKVRNKNGFLMSSRYAFQGLPVKEGAVPDASYSFDSRDDTPGILSDRRVEEKGQAASGPGATALLVLVTIGDPDALYVSQSVVGSRFDLTRKTHWHVHEPDGEGGQKGADYDKDESQPVGEGRGSAIALGESVARIVSISVTPIMQFSRKTLKAAMGSSGPAEISAHASYQYDYDRGGGKFHRRAQSSVRITLRPDPIEAVLEPVDKKGWQTWLPKGPEVGKEKGSDGDPAPGSAVEFHVRLVDTKNPKGPPPAQTYKVTYRLSGVSKNPGICMNYPAKDGKNQGTEWYDLRFDEKALKDVGDVSEKNQVFKTKDDLGDRAVAVCCYDYGAYGKLVADVELGGRTFTAKVGSGASTILRIPRDENENDVGDAWEEQYGVKGDQHPPGWDGEKKPDGASDGDGYTFYEEYRGFMLGEDGERKFTRLDPTVKKLLVFPVGDARTITVAAVHSFTQYVGIKTYVVAKEDDLKQTGKVNDARWSNFNKSPDAADHFAKDPQCAVRVEIVGPGVIPSAARATPEPGHPEGVTCVPAEEYRIAICPSNAAGYVNDQIAWMRAAGTDPKKSPNSRRYASTYDPRFADLAQLAGVVDANKAMLVDELFQFSFVHELGHTCGLSHHGLVDGDENLGDPTCIMRYWQLGKDGAAAPMNTLLPYVLGLWNPAANALIAPDAPPMTKTSKLVFGTWRICPGPTATEKMPCVKFLRLHR